MQNWRRKTRPKNQVDVGQQELFRNRLDQIIHMKHPLARLSELVNWERLHKRFSPCYATDDRAGLSISLMIGLHLLKHIYALSDEEVCARYLKDREGDRLNPILAGIGFNFRQLVAILAV